MNVRFNLTITTMLLALSLTAANKTIVPAEIYRTGATANKIPARQASQIIKNNYFVAWNSKDNYDYRVCLIFEVRPETLQLSSPQILNAKLKFTMAPWEKGRNALTVDQLADHGGNVGNLMYQQAATTILTDGFNQKQYQLDITDIVRDTIAKGNQRLIFRFSQDNDQDVILPDGKRIVPFGGKQSDRVMINSGGTIGTPAIEITYSEKIPLASTRTEPQSHDASTWQVNATSAISDHANIETEKSLANIIARIGNKPATVILSGSSRYAVKNKLEIPENIELVFRRGAVMAIEPTAELIINGYVNAGPFQIFDQQGKIGGAIKNPTVFPQWFGASGNAITDDTIALQQAVDFACNSMVLNVNLGRGKFRITKTLNCTNTRRPGTVRRDNLQIHGSSFFTEIIGDTGDEHAIIDVSGSQWLELQNFRIRSGTKNPSTVGIFSGCPKILPQCQNQVYHLYINLHDNINANSGKGTIGIWNFAAEENTYQSVYIAANRPVILTAFNNNPGDPLKLNFQNSYLEMLKVHSLGMVTFSGECFLNAIGRKAPAVTTNCANTVRFENTYLGGVPAGGKNAVAFEVYGSLVNLNYTGVTESLSSFMKLHGLLINGNINVTYGNIADKDAPLLRLGNRSKIVNTTFKFQLEAFADRNLFALEDQFVINNDPELSKKIKAGQVDDIAPEAGLRVEEVKSTALINSFIYTNLSNGHLNIPEVLKKASRNSFIYGRDKEIKL